MSLLSFGSGVGSGIDSTTGSGIGATSSTTLVFFGAAFLFGFGLASCVSIAIGLTSSLAGVGFNASSSLMASVIWFLSSLSFLISTLSSSTGLISDKLTALIFLAFLYI